MNKQVSEILKKSNYSVFLEMQMLPPKEKNAASTLFAFYSHLNDILQSQEAVSKKTELLKLWYQEINNIYDKKVPASNIGRDIYKNCQRFRLPKSEFLALLNTVEKEIEKPLQAPTLIDFYDYCSGIAVAPSSMMLRILGCKDEKLIKKLSLSLGQAIQMTNILKDIRDDAIANKLYIPCTFLKKAGISSKDPQAVITDKNLIHARQLLADVAEKNFEEAFSLISKLDKKTKRSIKAVAYVYKKYFDMMKQRGWEVISPKPQLNTFSKMFLVLKAYSGR